MLAIALTGYEYGFAVHLRRLWARHLQMASTDYHLQPINNYLSKYVFTDQPISCQRILTMASQNLIIVNTGESLSISVNPNVLLGNYNLSTICQLINRGNIDIRGYPIFSQTAMLLINNIDSLYYTWKEQVCP